MSLAWCIRELAARHRKDPAGLVEMWEERAAIHQYVEGCSRRSAELWAIGDVERMFHLGLHCPETMRRWAAGGERVRRTREMSDGFTMLMAFREAWDERGTADAERAGGFTWWMRVVARHEKMFGSCPVFQTDRGEEI